LQITKIFVHTLRFMSIEKSDLFELER